MARATSGRVSAADTASRRRMSRSSGFVRGCAWTAFGSSAIPQIRHGLGFVSTTSGSIGQIHSAASAVPADGTGAAAARAGGWVAGAAIADALGPRASQWPGSATKRSRQRGLQNQ